MQNTSSDFSNAAEQLQPLCNSSLIKLEDSPPRAAATVVVYFPEVVPKFPPSRPYNQFSLEPFLVRPSEPFDPEESIHAAAPDIQVSTSTNPIELSSDAAEEPSCYVVEVIDD